MKFLKNSLSITIAIVAIISSNVQGASNTIKGTSAYDILPDVVEGTPVYGDVAEGTPVYGTTPDTVKGTPVYGTRPDTVKGTPVYGARPAQQSARQTHATRGTPRKVNK